MPLRFRRSDDEDDWTCRGVAPIILGHFVSLRFSEDRARIEPCPCIVFVIQLGNELVLTVSDEGREIDAILDPLHQRLASVA